MSRPISIRINILSSFFIVIGIIASSLLGLQYYFSQELAMSAAHKNFTQSAQTITQYLRAIKTSKPSDVLPILCNKHPQFMP